MNEKQSRINHKPKACPRTGGSSSKKANGIREYGNRTYRSRACGEGTYASTAYRNRTPGNRAYRNWAYQNRVYAKRACGNRAYGTRAYGNRAVGNKAYGNRAYGNRAYGNWAYGNRTNVIREYGNRSYANKAYGYRVYGNRAYGNRAYGNGAHGIMLSWNRAYRNRSYWNRSYGKKEVDNGEQFPGSRLKNVIELGNQGGKVKGDEFDKISLRVSKIKLAHPRKLDDAKRRVKLVHRPRNVGFLDDVNRKMDNGNSIPFLAYHVDFGRNSSNELRHYFLETLNSDSPPEVNEANILRNACDGFHHPPLSQRLNFTKLVKFKLEHPHTGQHSPGAIANVFKVYGVVRCTDWGWIKKKRMPFWYVR
nr:unnamed protein product [Callosobruchus analis]